MISGVFYFVVAISMILDLLIKPILIAIVPTIIFLFIIYLFTQKKAINNSSKK